MMPGLAHRIIDRGKAADVVGQPDQLVGEDTQYRITRTIVAARLEIGEGVVGVVRDTDAAASRDRYATGVRHLFRQ